MATRISFSHTCLILDTSCVISLYASRQMRQILEAITESIKVAAQVNEEALWIYGGPETDVRRERERIDLTPLVEAGLLEIVELASEAEMEDYINFAVKLDPGEAATAAIAVNRDWAISVDDKKARTVLQREARHLQQFYTLELVKHWVDVTKPPSEIISVALWNIQMRGVYEPGRGHPFYGWWEKYRQD